MAEINKIREVANNYNVLSAEKETELIIKAKLGATDDRIPCQLCFIKVEEGFKLREPGAQYKCVSCRAMNALVLHNHRLIISIAKRYFNRGVDFADLVQYGAEGVKRAVELFEIERGHKLSTYASQWIRQKIGRGIENTGRLIRIPNNVLQKLSKIKRIYGNYIQEFQEYPPSELIAKKFNEKFPKESITAEEAEKLREYLQDIESLDKPASSDGDNLTLLHYVCDEGYEDEPLETNNDYNILYDAIEFLPEYDSQFIVHRYRLLDGYVAENTKRSDKQMSSDFGISMNEVQRKEKEILDALRAIIDRRSLNLEAEQQVAHRYTVKVLNIKNRYRALEAMKLLTGESLKEINQMLDDVPFTIATDKDYDEARSLLDFLAPAFEVRMMSETDE